MISRKTLLDAAAARRAKKGAIGRKKSTNPTQSLGTPPMLFEPADIIALRTKLGLSQRGFAKAIGCSYTALQKWEHGQRKMTQPIRVLFAYIAKYGILKR